MPVPDGKHTVAVQRPWGEGTTVSNVHTVAIQSGGWGCAQWSPGAGGEEGAEFTVVEWGFGWV